MSNISRNDKRGGGKCIELDDVIIQERKPVVSRTQQISG